MLGLGRVRLTGRPLTPGERGLVQEMFGAAVDPGPVRLHRRRFLPFQPANTIMAPDGHIWVPPDGMLWSEDYSQATLPLQGLFLHEMTHVWQAQTRGRWYLPLMRHPFCRYRYTFTPGRPLARYGLEQQGEIVRHIFLQRRGMRPAGVADLALLEQALPFQAA